MTGLTIEKMRQAMAVLERNEAAFLERVNDIIPIMVGPRQYQAMLDVARPSRRWARRFIRLSRREQLGLDPGQPYRSTALRYRKGRSAVVRRYIKQRVRLLPVLPSIIR